MRNICIVTGTRAEYGLLYWLMKEVDADPDLQLQIIATGMHLSPEFGLTYHQIEADGFTIDAKVEMLPAPYEFPESDKVVHVLVYAPLGFLMVYALSRSTLRLEPRPWPGALAQDSAPRAYWKVPRACPWGSTSSANLIFFGAFLAFLYGLTDEIHQYFVLGRDASALDAMADGAGAMIGSRVFVWTRRNGSKGAPKP